MRPAGVAAKHKTAKPTQGAVEPSTHCMCPSLDNITLEASATEHYEHSMIIVVTKCSSYTDLGSNKTTPPQEAYFGDLAVLSSDTCST